MEAWWWVLPGYWPPGRDLHQWLIELADGIEQLQVEALYWCGARATHHARTVGNVMVVEGEQVLVGDVNRPAEEVGYEVLRQRHRRA